MVGGQALALESVNGGTIYLWSTEYVDISDLTNYTSKDTAATDYASCENSAKIRAQGTSSTYPAVWAAREYKTVGTEAGDWCLPAAGIFTSYYNNQETINTGFDKVNGKKFTDRTFAWASSEFGFYNYNYHTWNSNFSSSLGLYSYNESSSTRTGNKENAYSVYPVLEF